MRAILGLAILAAGLSLGGAARAQSWNVQLGYGPAYVRPMQADWQDWQFRRTVDAVCSGRRAGMLEQRLRHECDEGDWRSVGRIAERYNGIEGWINGEARRSHWRAGW